MQLLKHLFLVMATLVTVQAVCNKEVLKKINQIWKGSEPENLMTRWMGTSTHVWMTTSAQTAIPGFVTNVEIQGNISCYQTEVSKTKFFSMSTDYLTLQNGTKIVSKYYQIMEWPGRVTIIDDTRWSDYYMHLFYLKNQVSGYYLCDSDPNKETTGPDGFGIQVVNYTNSKEQQRSIRKAKEVFKVFKYPEGQDLRTDCF